jgi:hypothetical protein
MINPHHELLLTAFICETLTIFAFFQAAHKETLTR